MEKFIARQPIFTNTLETYGYELLFRSSEKNTYTGEDGVISTSQVLSSTFSLFDIEELINGKKAFINFPEELLLNKAPSLFPKNLLVVEVLEDVEPSEDIVKVVRELKKEGYIIALDDFIYKLKYIPLIKIADIIKIDFFITKGEARGVVLDEISTINKNIKFLAEKVETQEEFEEAKKFGYSFFQGYFFAKPHIVSKKDIPGYKITYMRILDEVNKEDIGFDRIENILKTDVSLSYKFLKYINSAFFSFSNEIRSIRQALTLLGVEGIKKWITITLLGSLGDDKPQELIVLSVFRAKFCENLGAFIGFDKEKREELFLLGLFSLIDAILGRPKAEIFESISLEHEIKEALTGKNSIFSDILNLVIAYEEVNEEKLTFYSEKLKMPEKKVEELYWESLKWTGKIFIQN